MYNNRENIFFLRLHLKQSKQEQNKISGSSPSLLKSLVEQEKSESMVSEVILIAIGKQNST